MRRKDEVVNMVYKNVKQIVSSFCRLMAFAVMLMPLCIFGDGFLDDDLTYYFGNYCKL